MCILTYESSWTNGNTPNYGAGESARVQLRRYGSFGYFTSALRLYVNMLEEQKIYDQNYNLVPMPVGLVSDFC